jgi:AraC-like DNA-binding protein
MSLNFWFILLVIAIGQGLFLLTVLYSRPLRNSKSQVLLLSLLVIILCSLFSNAWTSSNLYRLSPFPSLFTRGMVLLLGPVIYLYVRSSIEIAYTFRLRDLVHFIPYALILIGNVLILSGSTIIELIESIDTFRNGKSVVDPFSFSQFVLYFIHLSVYLIIILRTNHNALHQPNETYIISLRERIAWAKKFYWFLGWMILVFTGFCCYILITGISSIEGNIVYTVSLSLLVYMISYKAMKDNAVLMPTFDKRYASQKMNDDLRKEKIEKIIQLFEQEKVFTDPNLTVQLLAQKAAISPHLASQLINEHLHKNFTELLNHYRIEAFRKKIADPAYKQYSITGIASEVGYQSKSTFYNAFRKIMQQTPNEYLKNLNP